MLIAARTTLILTALVVGLGVYGLIGSCMGTRNCHSGPGTSLFFAILVSAPFGVSGLTFSRHDKDASIINLMCFAMIFALVCFLFSSPALPWNLISEVEFLAAVENISFSTFLFSTLPSMLIHMSFVLMLCIAPKNIKSIMNFASKDS